jgi:transcriptional regulator with XRE-family HTH domain
MFPERLKLARKNKGLTLEELAAQYNHRFNGADSGLNKGTLSKYENNRQTPLVDTVSRLAEVLNVSTDYLLGKTDWRNENERVTKFAEWDAKHNSNGVLETSVKRFEEVLIKLKVFDVPVSAGTGAWLGEGTEYTWADFSDVPREADFALKIRGDSMEPMYSDGNIVFVKQNVIVESGQIGVFYLNGEGFLKMLQGNRLVSLNPEYSPVVINERDDFFCAGRVVGKTQV